MGEVSWSMLESHGGPSDLLRCFQRDVEDYCIGHSPALYEWRYRHT